MPRPTFVTSKHKAAPKPATLRFLREQSGLTWSEFARVLGVQKHIVARWAKGGQITPSHADRLAEFARALRTLPPVEPATRRTLIHEHVSRFGAFPAPGPAPTGPAGPCEDRQAGRAQRPDHQAADQEPETVDV